MFRKRKSIILGIHLMPIKRVLIAYDNDDVGKEGRVKLSYLNPEFAEIPRLRPFDKDITDYYKSRSNLRKWIKEYLTEQKGENI